MSKEDFFSKFNIKDYNNQLENILERKNFSEGTKNILLNILYKIENSYDDYKKVKVNVKLKKELLEEIIKIIEENCKEIEIVKPKLNEKTKLDDKNYIIEKKKNKIISYPNEKNIFYALYHLQNKKFIIDDKHTILKESLELLLNLGYKIDKQEVIRDFDGWAWNIVSSEIENYIYNIIYQNIKILIGNEFLQNYIENNKQLDFINEFENKLNETYEENISDSISKFIYQISILEDIKYNENKKENILLSRKQLENEFKEMDNKKIYLQKLANSKKLIGKDIKKIDEILNNNKLLRGKFIEDNKELEEEKRIFSLSEYSDSLQTKRNQLLKELDLYSDLMKPMNFVKTKTEITKKYNLLNEIDFNNDYDKEINNLLIKLQKTFLKAINEKTTKTQTKKIIIDYIYMFRYYKLLYINDNEQIKDVNELSKELRETEKHLITKACKLKAINIICQNIEANYEIVSKILSYNIIELEDISLEFKKHDKNIILDIYDDDIIEDSVIFDGKEELNVKFNRKIKLFI